MIPVSCGEIADAVGRRARGRRPGGRRGRRGGDRLASRRTGWAVRRPAGRARRRARLRRLRRPRPASTASLTARPIEGSPCIVVADPQAALGALARLVVGRLPDLTVIALTGSSGQDQYEGPDRAADPPVRRDGVAGGLVQQRDRPPADRAAGDGDDQVPGRGDGRAAPRRHHLPVPASRRRRSAWCSTSAPRTSASSAARTTSRWPRAS